MQPKRGESVAQARPNPDLAMVALSAAIQLSRMLKEQEADPSPVKNLVDILRQTPGIDTEADPDHLSADPNALSLFSRALVDAQKEKMRTSESLMRLSKLLDGLQSDKPADRRSSQERMRAFCLALHSKLLAERFPHKDTETVLGDGLRHARIR